MKTFIFLLIASFTAFSGSAQTTKPQTPTAPAAQARYTCPMHNEVQSVKPGKCPKCGMGLTKVKKYTCPMHKDIIKTATGKCPKCQMDLTEIKGKG